MTTWVYSKPSSLSRFWIRLATRLMLKRERTMLRRTSGCEIAGSPTRGISEEPLLYVRGLGDLVQAVRRSSAWSWSSVSATHGSEELVVIGAQLHALLAAHARHAGELLHEHRVHKNVERAVGRLQQRREEVLLDARERERRAPLRTVEGDGDARLLVLARDAARATVAHRGLGAAILRVKHDLGARRRPEHPLEARAQLRKRDVVDALREVLVHPVVVHLAVPWRHGPLAGLTPRALGRAAARLLGLPVLLGLVRIVRDVGHARRR